MNTRDGWLRALPGKKYLAGLKHLKRNEFSHCRVNGPAVYAKILLFSSFYSRPTLVVC